MVIFYGVIALNLVLVSSNNFICDNLVRLDARQSKHVQEIHRSKVGEKLKVGIINGEIGVGTIIKIGDDYIDINIRLLERPPPSLPLTVFLSLPRPKMLKRCLRHLTALGVKSIILMNSYRVEKSFWQSPCLSIEKIHEQVILGLEQAKDTILPEIILENRFKPFVEDRVPSIVYGKQAMIAHPGCGINCPHGLKKPSVLAVGPEGGFISYEVEKFKESGFQVVNLGRRVLNVETAVTALVSKLYD